MKNILLLGGNGFIGYECTLRLLSLKDHFNIFIANRGKSFDWDKASIKEQVTWVKYNRQHAVEDYTDFSQLLQTTDFHAVVDFSAFKRSEVKRILPQLEGNTKLYIFISTDSVYEVCNKENPDAPTKETDDKRPSDRSTRRKLKKADEYGHDKLKCEEYIKEFCNKHELDCVILRLADVIGPRDGTDRWWQYQLWVTLCTKLSIPLYVPASLKNQNLSFVYVKDIADVICSLVTMDDKLLKVVCNQSFNLACSETTTVVDLLNDICACLNPVTQRSLDVRFSDDDSVPQMYPSVEKGPIDIIKVRTVLKYTPTPLSVVIKFTVEFYEHVLRCDKFSEEKQDIFDSFMEGDLKSLSLYTPDVLTQFRELLMKLLELP